MIIYHDLCIYFIHQQVFATVIISLALPIAARLVSYFFSVLLIKSTCDAGEEKMTKK